MADVKSKSCLEIFQTRVIDPVDKDLAIGDPRSTEYRNGMLDAYAHRELRIPIPRPLRYKLGTSQADAYFAGNERGHALWRRLHLADSKANTPSHLQPGATMSTIQTIRPSSIKHLCVNCRHIKEGDKCMPSLCAAPSVMKTFSLVSGRQVGPYCGDQRSDRGECTPAGLLFERAPQAYAREPYSRDASAIDSPAVRTDSDNASSAGAMR